MLDALFGLDRAPLAFEAERPGHDGNRQDAHGPRDVSDHRSGARAGPATFAGGNKDHVALLERVFNLRAMIFGGLATDLGVAARTQSSGQFTTDVQLEVSLTHE